jgi:cyclophilin family peptidyl-prolyl cis-trans isomerase
MQTSKNPLQLLAALIAASLLAMSLQAQDVTPQAPPDQKPANTDPKEPLVYVLMTTSKGEILLELNREKAPISVDNFVNYTHQKFYDGTIFHRVIPTFMIQGGGFTPDMKQKSTGNPIKNEWQNGLKNVRGSIAMARTTSPDSATAQFFINVKDNPNLDQPMSGGAGYAVFGKVVAGMEVVDAIKTVATTTAGGHQNVPVEPVTIKEVKTISADDAKKKMQSGAPTP